jgi:cytochrome P450
VPTTTESLLAMDPFSLEVMADPLPFYKALRDEQPVRYYEEYDTFFFSRFADVWEVLRVGDNILVASETNLPTPQYMRTHRNNGAPPLASTNPMAPGPSLHSPYYEQMRQAHMAPLKPKHVQTLETFVLEQVRARLDELLPRGQFDLVSDYAGMTAASVVCHLFGIPLSSAGEILHYVYQMTRFDPEKGGVDLNTFFVKLKQFIVPPVQARREAGADGGNMLIDGLINFRTEDGRALGDNEIADQLVCVMSGGLEAVAKVSAQGIMELWKRPDQLAAVRADLDANIPIAVEEIVRYCAPAQYTIRTAHKDAVIAGQPVRAGQRVACMLYSAARDEREFANPDTFIWDRPIERVISFGLGQHHCVGKHVGLLEVRTLVREFLARVDSFEILVDQAVRNPSCFQRGYIHVPVVIGDAHEG